MCFFVNFDSNTNNKIEIGVYFQNVCGISNKVNDFELYLSTELDVAPNYICLAEHFLTATTAPLLKIDNYEVKAYNARINKTRGGTLILAKGVSGCEEIKFSSKVYKRDIFEICGVRDLDTNLNIFCIYRVPDKNNFDNFLQSLELLLENCFNKKTIISGDFNVDLLKDNEQKTNLQILLRCYNYRFLVDSVTFIRNECRSCIDNIITNVHRESVLDTSIEHNNLADGHAALTCRLSLDPLTVLKKPTFIIRELRTFNDANNDIFRRHIQNHNWTSMGLNSFISNFKKIFNLSFVKRSKKLQRKPSSHGKWITKGLKCSSKMKRFLNTCSKSNTDDSILLYKKNYIKIFKKTVIMAKKIAVNKEIQTSSNIPKTVWNIINRRCNKESKNSEERLMLKVNEVITTDPKIISNAFSRTFNSGSFPENTHVKEALSLLVTNAQRVANNCTFEPVSYLELSKIVKGIKSGKSVSRVGRNSSLYN